MARAATVLPPRAAVFLLSLGLLLFELSATRVLSVVFYYHTAFLAVSVALLGLAAGALLVYARNDEIIQQPGPIAMATALTCVLFPMVLPIVHLDPAQLQRTIGFALTLKIGFAVGALVVPFLGGGIVLALLFRRHRAHVGRLYAADLAGAAAGALLLVPAMEWLGGPGALLFCGLLIAAAALLLEGDREGGWRAKVTVALLLAGLTAAQVAWDTFKVPIGLAESGDDERRRPPRVLAKKWNAFSRVVAVADQGWSRGLSENSWRRARKAARREIEAIIDINAYAPIVPFDGDRTKVAYLRELVSNLAYRVLPDAPEVAIIGPGGGKDVLGALLFDARRVVGIELNPILVEDLVRGQFRAFCGDIYGDPRVDIRIGEGRAELARMDDTFDLVLLNSVATWAASSSGAMSLAEQPLFTERAFGIYFERILPDGILSISLWDTAPHALPLRILETCRVVDGGPDAPPLAGRTAVIGNLWGKRGYFTTVMVACRPFTPEQCATLRGHAARLGFEALYLPGSGDENRPVFRDYFADPAAFAAGFPRVIRPATDDRPFFFYNLRLGDALRFWAPETRTENAAYFSLLVSLVLVTVLTALLIGPSLRGLDRRRGVPRALSAREVLYFAAVGAGFMLAEITLVQRMTVVLGHPTHAFTTVIAGLLCWSGLGSRLSDRWTAKGGARARLRRTGLLLVAVLVLAQWLPAAVGAVTAGAPRVITIAFALLALAPLGLLMGAMFPAGLAAVGRRDTGAQAVPWAWGVNGAAGVLAGVVAVVIAVLFGFTAAWALAIAAYLAAVVTAPDYPEPGNRAPLPVFLAVKK